MDDVKFLPRTLEYNAGDFFVEERMVKERRMGYCENNRFEFFIFIIIIILGLY